MTRVAGGAAIDDAGEPGRVDTFFLGASVPSGTQSVVVNRTNNATIMYAVAMTVTAASDTGTTGIVLLQQDGTYAVQSVNDGSPGANSLRFAAGYTGATTPVPAGTGSTLGASIDLGSYGASAVYEAAAGQGARNIGFNYATLDDRAAVHLAVREVADITPPAVSSIVRVNTSPTNATSVQYTVTFSESVTGVDANDFTLNVAGVTAASVTGVSGTGSTYTVTVNSGSGNGTIRLDLTDDDTIADGAGNKLGGTGAGNGNFTSGQVYTMDKTLPTLSPVHIASNNADPTKAFVGDIVTLTFTSSESITTPSVTIAGNSAAVSGGPTGWSATRTILAGDPLGAVTFSISSFNDQVGNAGSTVTTVTDSSSVTVMTDNATLTITMAGTGDGTINSTPSGIICPGDCSEIYPGGTEVTLLATPDWKSDFVGWTVGCTGIGTTCIFTPSGDTGVTATFNYKPLVMMPGPLYYATIQDAYNACVDGTVLKGRDQTFTEDLVFDRAVNVTFEGGNNDSWTVVANTTINGTVTMAGVAGGSATISNLIIQ